MRKWIRHFLTNGPTHRVLLLCFLCAGQIPVFCQNSRTIAEQFPVIPIPQEIQYGTSETGFDSFFVESDSFYRETQTWQNFLTQHGLSTDRQGLKFRIIQNLTANQNDEGYSLKIDSIVTLSAASPKGIFYGIQSLKQLFRKKEYGGVLPQVNIVDWPAFTFRGFMHDTGRNFQSVQQLKEQIEVLAQYKYNIFHWHLTDNPGWRLQSKKYPQLQSEEAFSRDVGKYYTQEDFKEILAFCKARHITVIPEFDIPGHTAAFRRAFGFEAMRDPKVLPILLDLFDELMALADADEMPYIHIGTDEVRNQIEAVGPQVIRTIMERIRKNGREVIVWKEGIQVEGDTNSIQQLWAQHPPSKGYRFIDSRANYINHLDPLAGMVRLFFQQPCRQPEADSLALGGILCAWPDNDVAHEGEILRQNPIYPAMVFYADAIWKGKERNHVDYWANLPFKVSKELNEFREFEAKVLLHRDEFFKEKEFPYVKHSHIPWQLIGPFDHGGDFSKSFSVEQEVKEDYEIGGKNYQWQGPYFGGTIHLKHFFGFPSITKAESGTYYGLTHVYSPDNRIQDFWIGFHGWSRSGGRRGGPFPENGQWHHTDPKIWVNGKHIDPPNWQQPGLGVNTDEIPFIDEDYFYRKPTRVSLSRGWNEILLKVPHGNPSWKWMFTCVPITQTDEGVREAEGLRFSSKPITKEDDH